MRSTFRRGSHIPTLCTDINVICVHLAYPKRRAPWCVWMTREHTKSRRCEFTRRRTFSTKLLCLILKHRCGQVGVMGRVHAERRQALVVPFVFGGHSCKEIPEGLVYPMRLHCTVMSTSSRCVFVAHHRTRVLNGICYFRWAKFSTGKSTQDVCVLCNSWTPCL